MLTRNGRFDRSAGCRQAVRAARGVARRRPRYRAGAIRRHRRQERLRQEHVAAIAAGLEAPSGGSIRIADEAPRIGAPWRG